MRLALTGGIACGKSTAAAIFAKLGFNVVSADALAHDVLNDPATAPALRATFGNDVFDAAGSPLRPAIAARVFADTAARAALEAILHPEVNRRWLALTNATPDARWLVEIPLLFEKGLEKFFKISVCIRCTQQRQLERMATRGLSTEQALARIAAQLPLDEKVRRANHCISNDGSTAFLEKQIRFLAFHFL
jgi:dephospho-CoA kinase